MKTMKTMNTLIRRMAGRVGRSLNPSRAWTAGPVAAVLMAAGFLGPARPALAEPIHDCTKGCTIVTCDGRLCWVWRCQDGSCQIVGQYEQAQKAGPWAESAYVKLCPTQRQCDLYELSGSERTHLGRFDNLDGVVEARRAEVASRALMRQKD